jgi:hypothetical protein
MGRKKKKSKELEKPKKLNRLDIISKIDDLSDSAQQYRRQGNLKEAIRIVGKITNLAIQGNMPSYIKEQDEFLKDIAKEVKKDHIISKIIEEGESTSALYDKMIHAGKINEAHELVQDFKDKYQDYSYFNTLPIVKDLIIKDQREWIKRQSGDAQEVKEDKKKDVKDEMASLLKELSK